jgi:hypothetical protein
VKKSVLFGLMVPSRPPNPAEPRDMDQLMGGAFSRLVASSRFLVVCLSGCAESVHGRVEIETSGPLKQLFDPILVHPSVSADDIHDDDLTLQTSDDDELIQFVRRRVESERSRLYEDSRAMLVKRAEPGQNYFAKLSVSTTGFP